MTYPGLSSSLRTILLTHHSMRVRVEVLDLEMKATGQKVTGSLLDGQVNVDADAEVTRSLSVSVLDRDRQLSFDSNSPADGALFADRMLRVWYDVRAPLGQWVEVPVFTGPVVNFSRDGDVASVECHGKESLARGASVWRVMTFKKGETKVAVIRRVMRSLGERHLAFEEFRSKLPGDRSLSPEGDPWEFCQSLARSMGAQLYYDGFGRLRLRRTPARAVWSFETGKGGSIMTTPRVSYDIGELRNAVRVVGKKPKGAEQKVRATAVANSTHPLSPKRLGRNGESLYRAEFIDDSSIGSEREARQVASSTLQKRLLQVVTVEADVLVVPHLEEGDVVSFRTDDFGARARARAFTIPLTASAVMSFGFHRRVRRPDRRGGR